MIVKVLERREMGENDDFLWKDGVISASDPFVIWLYFLALDANNIFWFFFSLFFDM